MEDYGLCIIEKVVVKRLRNCPELGCSDRVKSTVDVQGPVDIKTDCPIFKP